MPGEPFSLSVKPKSWKGVRDNEAPSRILDEEWVDSREVDARLGKRRKGMVQIAQPEGAVQARAVVQYLRPDGTRHRLVFTSSGKLWDDSTEVLTGLSIANFPFITPGHGTAFFVNGVDAPRWRDPADSTWKALQGVPADWKPKYATFHPLNKRLYIAPTAAGVDYYAWSNADFVGTNASFVSPGGGAEYVGGNREPITGIMHGLGDDTCIFTTDHVFQLRGLDPSNWRPRFVSGDIGLTAPRAMANLGHGIAFLHTSGLYLVNAVGAVTFPSLTEPKQRAWDVLRKTYEAYLQHAHLCWSSDEHTIYLFLPTSSSDLMGQLWKFYLPDGSISIHDVVAYHCWYEPPGKVVLARADGKIVDILGGSDDLGTPITGWLRTKIYGDTRRIRHWGVQQEQKMVVCFRPLSGTVKVKPIIYRQHERGIIEGTLQSINLNQTGDEIRATITLPSDPGWGLQLYIEGTNEWEFFGFDVEGEEESLE